MSDEVLDQLNILRSKGQASPYKKFNVQWEEGGVIRSREMTGLELSSWAQSKYEDIYFRQRAARLAAREAQTQQTQEQQYTTYTAPEPEEGSTEWYRKQLEGTAWERYLQTQRTEEIPSFTYDRETGMVTTGMKTEGGYVSARIEDVSKATGYSVEQLEQMSQEVKRMETVGMTRAEQEQLAQTVSEARGEAPEVSPGQRQGTYVPRDFLQASGWREPTLKLKREQMPQPEFGVAEQPDVSLSGAALKLAGTETKAATTVGGVASGAIGFVEAGVGPILEPFLKPATGYSYQRGATFRQTPQYQFGQIIGLGAQVVLTTPGLARQFLTPTGIAESIAPKATAKAAMLGLEETKYEVRAGGEMLYEYGGAAQVRKAARQQNYLQRAFGKITPRVTEADEVVYGVEMTAATGQEDVLQVAKLYGTATEDVGRLSGQVVTPTKESRTYRLFERLPSRVKSAWPERFTPTSRQGWRTRMVSVESEKFGGIRGFKDFRISKGKQTTYFDEVLFGEATKKVGAEVPRPVQYDWFAKSKTGKSITDFSFLKPAEEAAEEVAKTAPKATATTKSFQESAAFKTAMETIQSPVVPATQQQAPPLFGLTAFGPVASRQAQRASKAFTPKDRPLFAGPKPVPVQMGAQQVMPIQAEQELMFNAQRVGVSGTTTAPPIPGTRAKAMQVPRTMPALASRQIAGQVPAMARAQTPAQTPRITPVPRTGQPPAPPPPVVPPPFQPAAPLPPVLPPLGGGGFSFRFQPLKIGPVRSRWRPSIYGQFKGGTIPKPPKVYLGFGPRFPIRRKKKKRKRR